MTENSRDRRKNSSYPEIRVKRVWVNEFQLYIQYNVLLYTQQKKKKRTT